MDLSKIDQQDNLERMRRGDMYYAFTPDLIAVRARCKHACHRYNKAGEVPRRRLVELWRDIVGDNTPLPAQATTQEADDDLFSREPWVEAPIMMDNGINFHVGEGAFINYNTAVVDTCTITIGARTMVGPNCSFYSGTHPLDPAIRNGINGPESGKEIHIGEDCWLGGNVIILPGVTLGRGVTVGAGSVVTKSVPDFHLVAGNPAKILRKIESTLAGLKTKEGEVKSDMVQGAEVPMRNMDF